MPARPVGRGSESVRMNDTSAVLATDINSIDE
jgi:hypothetical protein